jgi:hypothetical protein
LWQTSADVTHLLASRFPDLCNRLSSRGATQATVPSDRRSYGTYWMPPPGETILAAETAWKGVRNDLIDDLGAAIRDRDHGDCSWDLLEPSVVAHHGHDVGAELKIAFRVRHPYGR